MKTAGALLLPLLIACGDAREARVELDLRTEPCFSGECTTHLIGQGLIYTSGSENEQGIAGEDALYSEIYTSSGALALVEIGLEENTVRTVRYREIVDGAVVLAARVENERVKVLANGGWTFAFEGYDPRDPGSEKPARTISNGIVHLLEDGEYNPSVAVDEPPPVVVHQPPPDAGTQPPPPPPPPRRDDDDDDDVEVHTDVYVDTSGCDDADYGDSGGGCDSCDSGSDSGCDDGSSGGCEGDSSGGGCDSGSSGGCEGDTASSAGDCDSCSGDVALQAPPEELRRRAMLGMLRLAWPIGLAGWFNRKKRDRSKRGLVHEALRAGALGARGCDDDDRSGEIVVEGPRATVDDQP